MDRFQAVPTKICFVDRDKIVVKFVCKSEGTENSQNSLEEQHREGGISLCDFKAFYRAAAGGACGLRGGICVDLWGKRTQKYVKLYGR